MLVVSNIFEDATVRECRLRDLAIGDVARVIGFEPTGREYRSRLLSMGLTHGTVIMVRNIAPMGDPIHIVVRDFDLSLRKDEADALILQKIGGRHRGQPRVGRIRDARDL